MTLPANHPRLTRRPFSQGELIADGLLHAVALLASIIGLAVLIMLVLLKRGGLELSAVVIYGIGLLAMFGFSAAYNLVPISPLKWVLRRFDHSAIYLMIAGTYTPLLVLLGDPFWAITLGVLVWAGAIAGIVLKSGAAGAVRPAFDRDLHPARLFGLDGHPADDREAAPADALSFARGWGHLCRRRGLLCLEDPAVQQRDLAQLRFSGCGLSLRGHRLCDDGVKARGVCMPNLAESHKSPILLKINE